MHCYILLTIPDKDCPPLHLGSGPVTGTAVPGPVSGTVVPRPVPRAVLIAPP